MSTQMQKFLFVTRNQEKGASLRNHLLSAPFEVEVNVVPSLSLAQELLQEEKHSYTALILDEEEEEEAFVHVRAMNLSLPLALLSPLFNSAEGYKRLRSEKGVSYCTSTPLTLDESLQLACALRREGEKERLVEDPLLHGLSETYAQGIGDKIEAVEKEIQALQREASLSNLQVLQREIHRIGGSAGTYGYFAVSDLCQQFEQELLRRIHEELPCEESWLAALSDFNRRLKHAFQQKGWLQEEEEQKEGEEGQGKAPSFPPSMTQFVEFYCVDEDEAFLSIIEEKARARGIEVMTENDIERAQETINADSHYIKMLIVNEIYNDERITGHDLVRQYHRKYGEHAGTIGMIFEEDDIGKRIQAMQEGVKIFLEKPFSIDKLLDACDAEVISESWKNFNVLIVDDDPMVREFAELTLRDVGLQAHTVTKGAELFETLENIHPDILLLDLGLPDFSGMDLLRLLRSDFRYKNLPIIVVTGYSELPLIEEAYTIGVDDYIHKPLVKRIFQARIVNFAQKIALQRSVRDRDPLTNLYNRRAFAEHVQMSMYRSLRHHKEIAFAIVDLDFFKEVNDRYGHSAGDEVLVHFSRMMTSCFRRSDLLGRWGGEEFALLLEDVTLDQAIHLLQSFLARVMEAELLPSQPQERMSFSCGVVSFPTHGSTIEELVEAADQALFAAKEGGRRAVYAYDEIELQKKEERKKKMVFLADENFVLLEGLQRALRSRGFETVTWMDKKTFSEEVQTRDFSSAELLLVGEEFLEKKKGGLLYDLPTEALERMHLVLISENAILQQQCNALPAKSVTFLPKNPEISHCIDVLLPLLVETVRS